jgi:glycosyltransferase involved in cell wall biosynthesis
MKRVLIVSYFFPPATNMGSHRILRFVRHLREFGWEPVVLTTGFEGWTLVDDHLVERVPPDVTVHRVASVDLTGLWQKFAKRGPAQSKTGVAPVRSQGLTTFLNRWVMIPDKCFPWIGPAARFGQKLKFDLIYSTSDPLSDHLVARRIAQATGVRYVAEFRDLWLGSPYFARTHPTRLHRALHARLERQVIRGTSAVVSLSRGIQQYFENAYPTCLSRVIYNCFDPEEYPAPAPAAQAFTILYAGALYSSRSPASFLEGFSHFVQKHRLTPAEAKFIIAGGSSDLDLRGMSRKHNVETYVELLGRLPHGEALARMQSATALLTIQSPEDDIHVPGKLFEYIGARRPIFAISQPCEVAAMVTHHQLGWVAEPNPAAVATRLDELYAAWKTRGHNGLAAGAADRFSVRGATGQLAALFDEVTVAR